MYFKSQQHRDNSEHPDFYVDLDGEDQAEAEFEKELQLFADEYGITLKQAWDKYFKTDGDSPMETLEIMFDLMDLGVAA